jgi:diadenosine tetraphosphate (Ap4A) HIT family hydrolase
MPLYEENSKKIKENLLGQLSQFPEDRREQMTKQINAMTTEQVEFFLKENNLDNPENNCIFCSIVSKQTNSYKIAEDNKNLAILELNPLSKGHALIVPKDHSQIVNKNDSFVEQTQKKLGEKFNPKEFQKNSLEIMGHKLLEIIPMYGGEKERHQATKKELETTQEEILNNKEIKIEPEESMPSAPEKIIPKLKPRIP